MRECTTIEPDPIVLFHTAYEILKRDCTEGFSHMFVPNKKFCPINIF